MMDSD
jgi:hypothetical protein